MILKEKIFNIVFTVVLFVQIFYLILSFFVPQLPGWKMFLDTERLSIEMTNEHHQHVSYQSYMPTTAYSFSRPTILSLTRFICIKSHDKILYLKINNNEKYEFQKPNCEAVKY
jgi:hypothetical protein